MSVQVEISIANGMASRHLHIELTSTPNGDGIDRALDEVGDYAVLLSRPGGQSRIAEFHHRYGDDVLELIVEAVVALREVGVDKA